MYFLYFLYIFVLTSADTLYSFAIQVKGKIMAITNKVESLNFNAKRDPELIAKLNAVAPYERRKVHTLARLILLKYLDERIEELSIDIYEATTQPTVG